MAVRRLRRPSVLPSWKKDPQPLNRPLAEAELEKAMPKELAEVKF